MLQAMYETTAGQRGERAVLTVYTADRTADALAAMSDAERNAVVRAELERLYPGCSPEIERTVTVAWCLRPPSPDVTLRSLDGAYSHFRPGDVTRFGPRLAEPIGRLHLAGEHTDPWQATMNGALASGVRAAREYPRPTRLNRPEVQDRPAWCERIEARGCLARAVRAASARSPSAGRRSGPAC